MRGFLKSFLGKPNNPDYVDSTYNPNKPENDLIGQNEILPYALEESSSFLNSKKKIFTRLTDNTLKRSTNVIDNIFSNLYGEWDHNYVDSQKIIEEFDKKSEFKKLAEQASKTDLSLFKKAHNDKLLKVNADVILYNVRKDHLIKHLNVLQEFELKNNIKSNSLKFWETFSAEDKRLKENEKISIGESRDLERNQVDRAVEFKVPTTTGKTSIPLIEVSNDKPIPEEISIGLAERSQDIISRYIEKQSKTYTESQKEIYNLLVQLPQFIENSNNLSVTDLTDRLNGLSKVMEGFIDGAKDFTTIEAQRDYWFQIEKSVIAEFDRQAYVGLEKFPESEQNFSENIPEIPSTYTNKAIGVGGLFGVALGSAIGSYLLNNKRKHEEGAKLKLQKVRLNNEAISPLPGKVKSFKKLKTSKY